MGIILRSVDWEMMTAIWTGCSSTYCSLRVCVSLNSCYFFSLWSMSSNMIIYLTTSSSNSLHSTKWNGGLKSFTYKGAVNLPLASAGDLFTQAHTPLTEDWNFKGSKSWYELCNLVRPGWLRKLDIKTKQILVPPSSNSLCQIRKSANEWAELISDHFKLRNSESSAEILASIYKHLSLEIYQLRQSLHKTSQLCF